MKKRRIIEIVICVFCLLMLFTACEKDKDIVRVKSTEKEIELFSPEDANVKLRITVEESGKKETFEVVKEIKENQTTRITVEEIKTEFLSNNTVILKVAVENVSETSETVVGRAISIFMLTIIAIVMICMFSMDIYRNFLD